jgi:hypothetical protein
MGALLLSLAALNFGGALVRRTSVRPRAVRHDGKIPTEIREIVPDSIIFRYAILFPNNNK